jgi:hypothetical protein
MLDADQRGRYFFCGKEWEEGRVEGSTAQKADIKIDWRDRRELPDCGGSSGTRKGLGNRLSWDDITERRRRIKYERQRRRTAAAVEIER